MFARAILCRAAGSDKGGWIVFNVRGDRKESTLVQDASVMRDKSGRVEESDEI